MESGEKRYYSIRQVADLFNVNISKLRYYEKEFPTLSPKKNRSGDRVYTKAEVEHLREILDLVENRGYKLQGAREYLTKKQLSPNDTVKMLDKLREIRQFMVDLRATFEPAPTDRELSGSDASDVDTSAPQPTAGAAE